MKRRALAILSSLLLILSVPACDGKEDPVLPSKAEDARSEDQEDNSLEQTETTMTIRITAGGKTFTADIEDNQTGKAFIAKLSSTDGLSSALGSSKVTVLFEKQQ